MSVRTKQIASMVEMLPVKEQEFAFEMVKRLMLAWDPNYTKLTPSELRELEEAEVGEYLDEDEIDWDNLEKYAA